jgi:hypothetical protein
MNRHLLIVLTNAAAGRDIEFNEWYDRIHIPDALAIPGFVSARRFEMSDLEFLPAGVRSSPFRYLTLYEIDGDPSIVLTEWRDRLTSGSMRLSDSIEMETSVVGLFAMREQCKDEEEA